VLAGPVCQRPTSALPRLPLSLPHPTADTGPRCCLTPPVSRVALAPPPSPVCQPASATSARYPLRPRRPEPFRPHGPPADPPPYFSLSPSVAWHVRADPPPISLSALPARQSIWRRRRRLTPLRFAPEPELELPSFSTAYASASPASAIGDPPSSPVPVRAPQPPPLHGETLPSATVVPI
jgi:hypothetical protein